MEIRAQNLNKASIELARLLMFDGIRRKTRGFDCVELSEPVLIHIDNPTDRYLSIPNRKNHKTLPFAESLALASGVNNMDLYAGYVPNMMQYSDDGKYQRAGYGPRIRAFTGLQGDYKIDRPEYKYVYSGSVKMVDQLRFVIETLERDINSRQAVITIHDPAKDCFGDDGELLATKDQPCSRSLQFMVVDNKLDLTLYIRSNDFLFGFQAVNVFNFTFMQEYVASLLGLKVGRYHHFANNFHYYDDKTEIVDNIALQNLGDYDSEFDLFQYELGINNLSEFDFNVSKLFEAEGKLRTTKTDVEFEFESPFFKDWLNVFRKYHLKKEVEFINPYLNKNFGVWK